MSSTDLPRARALFARYGRDTVSGQSLEPGLCYWFYGDGAGDGTSARDDDAGDGNDAGGEDGAYVAYQETRGAWVAVGGPIGPQDKREEVMQAFADAAKVAGKRVRFFAIEDCPETWERVFIGQQPEWDPKQWKAAIASKASLREQLRRARAKSVTVRSVAGSEISSRKATLHAQICRMVRDWQKNQAMAPMSFLVSIDLFGNHEKKHYFVAERQGQVVAILVALDIPDRSGWFFEDVLRAHDAPNGSIELLFDHAMRAADSEEIQVVSFGLAPLSGAVSTWLAKVRDHSRWLYDFEGLRAFKSKLLPTRWNSVFLAFPKEERGISATIDSLTAFAGGSPLRFGLRTVIHAQPTLLWWLAVLLIPWTVLLGQMDVGVWFPTPAVKAAWLGFDMLLCAGLLDLAIDWRRNKAQFWAMVSAADALMGAIQLVQYNQYHLQSALQWTVAIFAVLAPLGAATILAIGAVGRDRLYLRVPRR